jgi:hypothetical protein
LAAAFRLARFHFLRLSSFATFFASFIDILSIIAFIRYASQLMSFRFFFADATLMPLSAFHAIFRVRLMLQPGRFLSRLARATPSHY